MARSKQPVEALIVQYFTEQPLAACESVKRIVDDIIKHRRSRPEPGVNPIGVASVKKERKRRTAQRSLLDTPAAHEIVDERPLDSTDNNDS